jgi:hypothetical protein
VCSYSFDCKWVGLSAIKLIILVIKRNLQYLGIFFFMYRSGIEIQKKVIIL